MKARNEPNLAKLHARPGQSESPATHRPVNSHDGVGRVKNDSRIGVVHCEKITALQTENLILRRKIRKLTSLFTGNFEKVMGFWVVSRSYQGSSG